MSLVFLPCSLSSKANAFEGAANMIHLCRRGRPRLSHTWFITWWIKSYTRLMHDIMSLSLPNRSPSIGWDSVTTLPSPAPQDLIHRRSQHQSNSKAPEPRAAISIWRQSIKLKLFPGFRARNALKSLKSTPTLKRALAKNMPDATGWMQVVGSRVHFLHSKYWQVELGRPQRAP